MAQFLPTFNSVQENVDLAKSGEIGYKNDGDELEEIEIDESLSKGNEKYTYYFIVDRSGSMMGDKIKITRQSMKLFMQSLPLDSQFAIVSFGSEYRYTLSEEPIEYNDENLELCKVEIGRFEADFGGTDILEPLKSVFQRGNQQKSKTLKRIFLLTDGCVGNTDIIISTIKTHCKDDGMWKLFTFGIGDGCSRHLVIEAAKAGRGDYSFVDE